MVTQTEEVVKEEIESVLACEETIVHPDDVENLAKAIWLGCPKLRLAVRKYEHLLGKVARVQMVISGEPDDVE